MVFQPNAQPQDANSSISRTDEYKLLPRYSKWNESKAAEKIDPNRIDTNHSNHLKFESRR